MSAVGLTKAMRKALEDVRDAAYESPMIGRLIAFGFVEKKTVTLKYCGIRVHEKIAALTPRGHAALAAPRMTYAEYSALRWYEGKTTGVLFPHGKTVNRLIERKWLTDGWMDRNLTHAGRTALNNMRAAEGSPDYKESK